MKIIKLAGLILAAAGLVGMTAGLAHADTLDTIKKSKKIKIAIDTAVPPYAMMNDSLQAIGSDVETAELLAKDLGAQIEIVRVNGANRIPFLISNKADIVISQLSITPEREKVIDFSTRYSVIQAVLAAPTTVEIKSYADLAGKRVVTTRGTASDQVLTENSPGANIVRFEDDATSMTALVSGQADIFGTTPALVAAINQKITNRKLEAKFVMRSFNLGIGIRKGDTNLRTWVDGWVQENLKNGKLNAIHKKYHGTDLPQDLLNSAS
jgi:polar amino acid transport system substrate-binding protein